MATLFAMRLLGAYNDAEAARAVDLAAQALERNVSKRVGLYQYGLLGARGAIVVLGDGGLNRQVFARYVTSRNHAVEFPGVHGFGFIRRVPQEAEASFVAKAREEGLPDFSVRQYVPHDGERYVVQYIEPEKDNLGALGRDIASEPVRREAAIDSMRSGRPRLTAPYLTSDFGGIQPRTALLLVLPLYRGSQHLDLPSLREDSALGWVFARLLVDEMFDGVATDLPGIHFAVSDIDVAEGAGELFSTLGQGMSGDPSTSREFEIFGRHWRLRVAADPSVFDQLNLYRPQFAAAAGLVTTLLAVLATLLLRQGVDRDRAALQQRTQLAAIIDSANDGIVSRDLDGVVTSWNRAAESIFGFTAEDAIGRSLIDLVIPDERKEEDARLMARVRDGLPIAHFETVRRHKDGRRINVSVTISPVWDPSGRVIGASKTVRDISARKEAEAKILELNATLERQVADRTQEIGRMSALQTTILNSAGYAIIAMDVEERITLFNPAAEALLGYRASEVIGRAPELLHLPEEVEARQAEFDRMLGRPAEPGSDPVIPDPSKEGPREWTYVRKDGSRLPVLLKVTLMRDPYGEFLGSIAISVDLTERKRAEEELRQAQETLRASEIRFRGAFETVAQGMALVSLDGHFLQVNESLCQMLGYDEAELLAIDFQRITHPDDLAADLDQVAALLENRADSYQLEKRYIHKEGRIIWILLSVSIVRTAAGEPVEFVAQILDITEKHEAEAVLIEARRQAEAADRAKSEFLANISHEIRTPMNAILGLSHIVNQTDLSSEQRDYVTKIETAGRSLLGILNDILDYSKIEANRLDLETIDFDLGGVIEDLSVIMSVNGRDKGLELAITLGRTIPRLLRGDPSRLQQVLINLTGNALKFTKQGSVAVRAELVEHRDGRVLVKFSVEDSGIGMAPETLSLLFQPFSQADATTTRRFGGTGLGLAISKRLVELMGGEIGVESDLGRGSIFWFTIPFGEHADLQPQPVAPAGLKVLIVDDAELARKSLTTAVETLGWQAEAVNSGAAALERLAQPDAGTFDMALVDWQMPGMNGLEAAEMFKAPPISARAPVVVMVTGFGREELHNAPQAAVADAILIKPVTETALAHVAAELAGVPAAFPAGPVQKKVRRLAGIRVLVVEDNSLNQEVARKILQNEGALVAVESDGQRAIDHIRRSRDSIDIVLMDAQMPVMDGFEASTYVRETLNIRDLPILAVTAGVRASDKAKCLAAGMTDFVAKPLDVEKLIATILLYVTPDPAALATEPARIETARQGGPSLAVVAAALGLERPRLEAISDDGDKTLLPLLRSLADSAVTLAAGIEAALQQGDREAAAHQAHTLRGSSANFGADAIAGPAGRIEERLKDGEAPVALTALAKEARAAAEAYAAAMKRHFPASQPQGANGRDIDPVRLGELLALLRVHNFAALDLFADLAADLRGAWPEDRFRAVEAAIEGLAFDAAVELIALAKDGLAP
jgi:PAS domain S-box-containing protein